MKFVITKKVDEETKISIIDEIDDTLEFDLQINEITKKFNKFLGSFQKNNEKKDTRTRLVKEVLPVEENSGSTFISKIASYLGYKAEIVTQIFALDFSKNPVILIPSSKISAYDALRLCIFSVIIGLELKKTNYDDIKSIFLPIGFNSNNFRQAIFKLKNEKEILIDLKDRQIMHTNLLLEKVKELLAERLKNQ